MSKLPTLVEVMADKTSDVMLPVSAASLPLDLRRVPLDRFWAEVYGPLSTQGGCRYGCKVYGRQRGCVKQYAVLHSTAYGHARCAA